MFENGSISWYIFLNNFEKLGYITYACQGICYMGFQSCSRNFSFKKCLLHKPYYLLPVKVSRTFGQKQNFYKVNEKVSYGFTILKFYSNW